MSRKESKSNAASLKKIEEHGIRDIGTVGTFTMLEHWVLNVEGISLTAAVVYSHYWSKGQGTGEFFIFIDTLAEQLNLNEKTIDRSLKQLEELNLIARIRRGQKKSNFCYFLKHPAMNLRPGIAQEEPNCPIKNGLNDVLKGQNVPSRKDKMSLQENSSLYEYTTNNNISADWADSADCTNVQIGQLSLIEQSKKSAKKKGDTECPFFDQFYEAYPNHTHRKIALSIWNKKGLFRFIDAILADIEIRKKTEWKDREKNFIEQPKKYLRSECWTDDHKDLLAPVKKTNVSLASEQKSLVPDFVPEEIVKSRSEEQGQIMNQLKANLKARAKN